MRALGRARRLLLSGDWGCGGELWGIGIAGRGVGAAQRSRLPSWREREGQEETWACEGRLKAIEKSESAARQRRFSSSSAGIPEVSASVCRVRAICPHLSCMCMGDCISASEIASRARRRPDNPSGATRCLLRASPCPIRTRASSPLTRSPRDSPRWSLRRDGRRWRPASGKGIVAFSRPQPQPTWRASFLIPTALILTSST